MLKKNILITGGCRSGKSRHALSIAKLYSGKKVFLATAEALDDEMKERIARHRAERGKDWTTIEEPLDPGLVLKQQDKGPTVLVLDCLTFWISNLMMKGKDKATILKQADDLIARCSQSKYDVIVITNEVGAGIVPDNKLTRDFRDIAGEVNQRFAVAFDIVIHMVSGIPVTIKESSSGSAEKKAETISPHEFTETQKKGLYDAIYKRRDMRHFVSRPIDPSVLGKVLNAAHHAGSVGYMQPWNFLVINDPRIKEKIAQNFKKANETAAKNYSGDRKELYRSLKLEGITQAAINICVTCDTKRGGPNVLGRDTIPETDVFSTCCAVQNLWLAARAEGLAVGWVSILSPDKLKKDLEIPEHVLPVAYLCIGHTDSFYEKPMLETAGWGERLNLKNLIYYNKWKGDPGDFKIKIPDQSQ